MSAATTPKHLIVMAAGTGGHVIPGLAVAKLMQSRGWTVSWFGTPAGMENTLVPPTGISLDQVSFAGLRGKGLLGSIKGAVQLIRSCWQSLMIFRQRRPNVILGMGGYVCVPGGLAGALMGKRLVLVNADASFLMSNRYLLPLAKRIAFGFDGKDAKATKNAVVTGNPVRSSITDIEPPTDRMLKRQGPLRLLVVGGSSGAKALNELLPAALACLPASTRPIVTHQTGAAHLESVRASYSQARVSANIVPFINDMPEQLAACDLIVCRAGAITVSELCAAGVASILVPLVISTTSHQRDNAMWLASQGAAIHVPQAELSAQRLADLLAPLTRDQLLELGLRARALAKPDATAAVADLLESVCQP
jgi:UDP-N-acetylglucosamine--N-acetylmuramyl-(pentapeptide) pyrophosphoryl-undecaprenol N-acetylglucosamine transferase